MAHDVFISCSTENATVADAVCAGLERRGIRCWIAPRDITGGETWAGAIIRAIDTCKVFVLIVSSASNCSDYVLQEVQNAASSGVPIIPFRIEDIALSNDMRYYLGTRMWLDALTKPLEQHILRLAARVDLLLQRETTVVGQAEGDGAGRAAESIQSQSSVTADETSGAEVPAEARIAAGGSAAATEPLRSRSRMRLVIPAVALVVLTVLALFAYPSARNSRRNAAQGEAPPMAAVVGDDVSAAARHGESVPSGVTAGTSAPAAKAGKPWKPPRSGRRAGEEIKGPDGGTLVWVPAGSFMMGSEDGKAPEKPAHRVQLDGFWLGKCEVTNAQYRAFCEATGRELPPDIDEGDDHPVICVGWDDATAYCEHYGLSLPTEAQWEYAAAGPDSRKYPWGADWDPQKLRWYENLGAGGEAFPVGSFAAGASWCGALDMAGNVSEWCADWYHSDYYWKAPGQNPPGPSESESKWGGRVVRGGSWVTVDVIDFRCASRDSYSPGDRDNDLGFRCARTL